jgi:hypothetical protein
MKQILEDPEYKKVREHANFVAMMERESGNKEDKSSEEKSQAVEKKEETKMVVTEEVKDVDESLKVAEDVESPPPVEEVKVEDDVVSTPSTMFNPEFRVMQGKLNSPVSFDANPYLPTINEFGFEDLINNVSVDKMKKLGRKMFYFAQTYSPIMKFDSLKISNDGYVDVSNHAMMPPLPIQTLKIKEQMFESRLVNNKLTRDLKIEPYMSNILSINVSSKDNNLLEVDPSNLEQNEGRLIENALINNYHLDGVIGISLAPWSETNGKQYEVKAAPLLINPNRIPLMLNSISAYNYTHLSLDDFVMASQSSCYKNKWVC